MKLKNKRFIKRQIKRIGKRKLHQRLISKLMSNYGSALSVKWWQFRIKIDRKVLSSNKISKKIRKLMKNKNVIEAKISKKGNF